MAMTDARPEGVPEMGEVRLAMLGEALRRGWADMRRAPGYAVFFAGVYVAQEESDGNFIRPNFFGFASDISRGLPLRKPYGAFADAGRRDASV